MNRKDDKDKANFIFGIRPIIEAVEAGKTIDKLFIQKGLHNDLFAELWKLVRLRRINYKHVPLEKINRLTRKNHQGVFAFISPIDFYNIEDVVPALYEEGKTNPKMMSVGLHCRLIGKPGRIQSLKKFLNYVLKHKDVWICKRIDIAKHWIKNYSNL